MDNAKAMALLKDIAQTAGEKGRVEHLDEVVIEDKPGVMLFVGWAAEKAPKRDPEAALRTRWWQRWFRR
jgi:hypothetical protein